MFALSDGLSASTPSWHDMQNSLPSMTLFVFVSANDAAFALHIIPNAPAGVFTGKADNALVEATNRLLPLFGIKDMYDRFTEPRMTTLPPEFMRLLTMFGKAFDDAIEEGVLPEDAKIDLTVITDDNGLQGLAGRIGMAAKSSF